MTKNYGFKLPELKPDHYVLGGQGSLPKIVLREDGQWDDFLPKYEPQFNEHFDSNGCTVWGTQNALEMLLKRLTGQEFNFSERFNYNLARIRPPGADPHRVIESMRANGLIDNDLLPMTDSFEEFVQPDPMTASLLVAGQRFPYELKHDWVWLGKQTKQKRIKLLQEALKYSPIPVSVTAWHERNGIYVDNGEGNNHWCVCYGWNDRGWKIFDSYDQSQKIASFDHDIFCAKRLLITDKVKNVNAVLDVLKRLLDLIKSVFYGLNIPSKKTA